MLLKILRPTYRLLDYKRKFATSGQIAQEYLSVQPQEFARVLQNRYERIHKRTAEHYKSETELSTETTQLLWNISQTNRQFSVENPSLSQAATDIHGLCTCQDWPPSVSLQTSQQSINCKSTVHILNHFSIWVPVQVHTRILNQRTGCRGSAEQSNESIYI
jgi:hypothetical protein